MFAYEDNGSGEENKKTKTQLMENTVSTPSTKALCVYHQTVCIAQELQIGQVGSPKELSTDLIQRPSEAAGKLSDSAASKAGRHAECFA